jgi:hypothetical protein
MNKGTLLALAFGALIPTASMFAAPSPGQIYEYQGNYYVWVDSYLTWDEAVSYSESFSTAVNGNSLDDWHVAAITSAAENDFIWNTVLAADSSIGEVWLGAIVGDGSVGNFQWLTGEIFGYSNFAPGQPDLARETVLEMGGAFGAQWNDEDRDLAYGSVPQTFVIEHVAMQATVVNIDVKPGGAAVCGGSIPVAVLGSAELDVSQIDPAMLKYEGLSIRIRGDGGPSCSVADANGDGYTDLVCQFQDAVKDGTLTGQLIDGSRIRGSDSVCALH